MLSVQTADGKRGEKKHSLIVRYSETTSPNVALLLRFATLFIHFSPSAKMPLTRDFKDGPVLHTHTHTTNASGGRGRKSKNPRDQKVEKKCLIRVTFHQTKKSDMLGVKSSFKNRVVSGALRRKWSEEAETGKLQLLQ